MLAGKLGRIDWYTFLRDTFTLCVVLLSISLLLINHAIVFWNALIMLFIYIIYTLVMKFNKSLERFLRKKVELREKFKLPKRLQGEELHQMHFNPRGRRFSISQLKFEDYQIIDGNIIFYFDGQRCKDVC